MLGRKSFRRWGCLSQVILLLFALDIQATTVIAPGFETLVDRAELIFTGQVIGQRSEWRDNNGQKSIVTLVTFTVGQIHKGNAGATVTLQFLGGTVGNVTLEVADIPKFKAGERVVLFIEGNGTTASPVIGFFHGRFSLRQDENGRDQVLTYRNEPLASVSEIGRAKHLSDNRASVRGLSHAEFSAKIRERVAATERK